MTWKVKAYTVHLYRKSNGYASRYVHTTTVVWTGPSWITDWNNVDWWVEDRVRILNEIYMPIYSTSGNPKPRFKVRDCGQLIDVAGQVVDCIVLVNGESWDAKSPDLTRQPPAIREQLQAQHPNHAQKGNVFNKFWRAILAHNLILQQNPVVVFHTYLCATATYLSHQTGGLRPLIFSHSFSGALGNGQNCPNPNADSWTNFLLALVSIL
jgi:hypothetical protein